MKKVAHKREQHAKGLGLKQPKPLALKLNHDDPAERSKRDTWMMRENKIPFGERDGTLFRALKSRTVFAAAAFAQAASSH